jgi:RNA polymerase sigma factor (TIGR02999 family)
MGKDTPPITQAINAADPHAANELLPLVYDELRRLAAIKMANERPGHTLNATALVHEAFLRLEKSNDPSQPKWDNQAHYYVAAAEAMRRILIENARRKKAVKHGSELQRTTLDDLDDNDLAVDDPMTDDILALHDALEKLAEKNERQANLVHLRYFAGLTAREAATTLDISLATAERDWTFARAWLHREISRP